ncbi:MAG: hypothetical protein ACF8TS_10545, partial [Maioricimonas sp. JB049]
MSSPCRASRLFEALRPVAAIGAISAGLFLTTTPVTDGAEPVLAPPASDDPAIIVPSYPPAAPAATPAPIRPETVQLLPPVPGDDVPDRISRIDPDIDPAHESYGPVVPLLTPTPPASAADVLPTRRPSTPIVERAELL